MAVLVVRSPQRSHDAGRGVIQPIRAGPESDGARDHYSGVSRPRHRTGHRPSLLAAFAGPDTAVDDPAVRRARSAVGQVETPPFAFHAPRRLTNAEAEKESIELLRLRRNSYLNSLQLSLATALGRRLAS